MEEEGQGRLAIDINGGDGDGDGGEVLWWWRRVSMVGGRERLVGRVFL